MAIHIQMMVHDKRRLYQTATMVVQRQLMRHRIANICHCHCALFFLLCRWFQVFFRFFFGFYSIFSTHNELKLYDHHLLFFFVRRSTTLAKTRQNWMFIYDFYAMWFLILIQYLVRFSVQQRIKHICFGSNLFSFASTTKINQKTKWRTVCVWGNYFLFFLHQILLRHTESCDSDHAIEFTGWSRKKGTGEITWQNFYMTFI